MNEQTGMERAKEVRCLSERKLEKAKSGNADAFIALCAPFEGMVYRHCLHMLKTPADAQDAAQETMLRAFRSFAGFQQRSELGTWLYRIAHNVCLDMIKRAHKRYENTSLDGMKENGYNPPSHTATPEDVYVQTSEQALLQDALHTLPDREQALLSLRFGDGMSYLQIAKAMHMPLGTVKSALSRARDNLRTALETIQA